MRAIAVEAGVAPSNAYYWFASKDQLVQKFYRRIQLAHRDRSAEALCLRWRRWPSACSPSSGCLFDRR